MEKKMARGGLKSYFSIFGWLPHDNSEWLQFDMIAALSVWALPGYALFGTSGQIVPGPGAALAAVTNEWIACTASLAVFAGLVYILLRALKTGWISHFLSGAVPGSFVFGFGDGLIAEQTPKFPGVPEASGSHIQVLIGVLLNTFSDSPSRRRHLGSKAGTNV
jgi:MFS superfamily sulfate permease-like transporter